jgi:hypothetical protein
MADKFVDHGLYPAYAAVPAWGVCQEGDGTSPGPATSAIGSVVFTQGHSAGSVAVFGATVTPATSASANAAADNLATAINASTVEVSSVFAPMTPQLRDAVYARGPALGAPAGTCQIMTRAGSAALNDAGTNTTLTQAAFNGAAPTLNQFSGGVGGAWGYFISTTVLWPSAVAVYSYGAWRPRLLAGEIGSTETVYVRAGNKTIVLPSAISFGQIWTHGDWPTYRVVSGAEVPAWAEDGATPTLTLRFNASTSPSCTMVIRSCALLGVEYAPGSYSLISETSSSSGGRLMFSTAGHSAELGFIEFRHIGSNSSTSFIEVSTYQSSNNRKLVVHDFVAKAPNVTIASFATASGNVMRLELYNFVVDATGASTPGTVFGGNSRVLQLYARAGRFVGFVTGSSLVSSWGDSKVTFQDMEWGNVANIGPYHRNVASSDMWGRYFHAFTRRGSRAFIVDRPGLATEWTPAKGFPTLSAVLPDGVTPWCWRLAPTTSTSVAEFDGPCEAPEMAVVNGLPDGPRTVTVQFCLAEFVAWTRREVSILVSYEDVSGDEVVVSSWDPVGSPLTVSTAVWSSEVGGKVVWNTPFQLLHNKYKLEVATIPGKDMKSGSVVRVLFQIRGNVNSLDEYLFLDPEPTIA